jgi:hypothetical protein
MTLKSALLFRKCSIKQSDIQYDILKTFEIRRIRAYEGLELIENFIEKLYFIDKQDILTKWAAT